MFISNTIRRIIQSTEEDSKYWKYDPAHISFKDDVNNVYFEFHNDRRTIYSFQINRKEYRQELNFLERFFLVRAMRKLLTVKEPGFKNDKFNSHIKLRSEDPEEFI